MSKLTDSLREGAHALLDKASDWQERIRQRAQAIWEREGRPEGRHEDHWREAEKEIAAEDSGTAAARKKTTVKKPRTAKCRPEARSHRSGDVRKSQRPWRMQQHPKRSRRALTLANRDARRSLLVPLPPRRAVLPRKAKPSRAAVHLGALPSQAGKRESPGRSGRTGDRLQALRSGASPRLTASKHARQAGHDDQDAHSQHQRSRGNTSYQVAAKRCREHATDDEADR